MNHDENVVAGLLLGFIAPADVEPEWLREPAAVVTVAAARALFRDHALDVAGGDVALLGAELEFRGCVGSTWWTWLRECADGLPSRSNAMESLRVVRTRARSAAA